MLGIPSVKSSSRFEFNSLFGVQNKPMAFGFDSCRIWQNQVWSKLPNLNILIGNKINKEQADCVFGRLDQLSSKMTFWNSIKNNYFNIFKTKQLNSIFRITKIRIAWLSLPPSFSKRSKHTRSKLRKQRRSQPSTWPSTGRPSKRWKRYYTLQIIFHQIRTLFQMA